MPDVLITEQIAGAPVEELKRTLEVSSQPELWKDRNGLLSAVRSARALIVRNQTQVTAELIQAAEKLEVIARAGVGLDNVDVEAATRAGVVVAFTPSQNSISVAELALGLMLGLARKIAAADRHVKAGGWARYQFMGSELYGKTLGVVGLGRIGCLTARRAAAFGMDIVAYDPFLDPDAPMVAEVRPRIVDLDELLAVADVVSCHLPCNAQTRGLFDYARFCRMKPTAMFVNVARGEVVDEPGLARALSEQRIAGAALDVRQSEPPKPGPLDAMDNVILVPHIGAFTDEGQLRVVASVCRDVSAVLAGGKARNYVNFPQPVVRQARKS
jgi:D-3-phosphoglycerate dehydrogenase / 2-oxoglutarate reductase